VADALSRIRVNAIKEIPPTDEIRVAQRRDEELQDRIQYMLNGTLPTSIKTSEVEKFQQDCDNYEIIDGLLFRKRTLDSPVIVIPDRYKEVMLYRFHSSIEGMHLGVAKVTNSLLNICWWAGLRKDVERYITQCDSCTQIKNPHRRIKVPMKTQFAQFPLETVSTDIAGPFPITKRGNKWILVIIDAFTRYADIIAMPDARAETVARVLVEEWITRYGISVNLLSDQGANYMSEVLKKVNNMFEIKHKRTTPYHPATNGLSERLIKTVKFCLASVVDTEQVLWDTYLCFIRMVINQSWHASTNASPAKLFFGREMMTPTKLLLPKAPVTPLGEGEYPEMLQNRMQYIWQKAREYMAISKEAQKHYYDRKLVPADIDVGSRVMKYSPRGKAGLATKLLHHWIGPYVVSRITDTNAWIRPISKPFMESTCIHLNMLKKYSGTNVPPEDTEVTDDEEEEESGLKQQTVSRNETVIIDDLEEPLHNLYGSKLETAHHLQRTGKQARVIEKIFRH
jgi:hypothetical protein